MEIIKDLPEIFDEFEDKKKQSFLKVKEYKEKRRRDENGGEEFFYCCVHVIISFLDNG